MLIAREKKKTNIAEYILYMWQIEDIIRSCNFDVDIIQKRIIDTFEGSEQTALELKNWYATLVQQMSDQDIKEKGHLAEVSEIVNELTYLHHSLLNVYQDPDYKKLHGLAKPNINELQAKTAGETNEVVIALNGLYGLFLLKLQRREISEQTGQAMRTFSKALGYLSTKYKEMLNGQLDLPAEMNN